MEVYLRVALDAPPPALGLSQVLSSVTGQEADSLTGGCPGLVPGWGPCYFPTQSHIWNSVFLRVLQLAGGGGGGCEGANLSANGVGRDFGNVSCP